MLLVAAALLLGLFVGLLFVTVLGTTLFWWLGAFE
jgi:hypothetical protein